MIFVCFGHIYISPSPCIFFSVPTAPSPPPGLQCKLWEAIGRTGCVCKMPYQCSWVFDHDISVTHCVMPGLLKLHALPFLFFYLALLCRCAPKSARVDPVCLKFVSLGLWGVRAGASRWPAIVTVTGQSCPRPVRTVNQEQSVRVSLTKIILSHYSCVNAKCHFKQWYCTIWAGYLPKVRGFVL